MSQRRAPAIDTTERYLLGAFDEFGQERQESMSHQIETQLLDPNELVSVPHALYARVTHPVHIQPEFEQYQIRGERQLKLELRGAETERRQAGGDFSHYSRVSMSTLGQSDREKPVLASALFRFNTNRLLNFDGRLFWDGHTAGIEDTAIETYEEGMPRPNMLLGYFKDVLRTRSASVSAVADTTVRASLATGQSHRSSRAVMRPTEQYPDLRRRKNLPPATSAERNDWMHAVYEADEQLTPGFGEKLTAVTHSLSIDRQPRPQRIITNFSRITVRAATPDAEPLLEGIFPHEDPFVFDGWCHTPIAGWQPCVSSYAVQTETVQFKRGEDVQSSTEKATNDAEAREMVQPFINAVKRLRRLQSTKKL